jgi:hypothetical protein
MKTSDWLTIIASTIFIPGLVVFIVGTCNTNLDLMWTGLGIMLIAWPISWFIKPCMRAEEKAERTDNQDNDK